MLPIALALLAAASPQTLITSASGVRLRAQPKAGTKAVAKVDIGTVLTVVDTAPDWFQVQTPKKKKGWIFGKLTRAWDDTKSVEIVGAIFAERVKKTEMIFADRDDLLKMMKRFSKSAKAPEDKAAFELLRFKALAFAARGIDALSDEQKPRNDRWVKAQKGDLVYHEPAGEWILAADKLWKSAAKYKATPAADEIGWLAATTGVPGECEGYPPCYIAVGSMTYGRYVERFPKGAHVKEADESLSSLLSPDNIDSNEREEALEILKELDDLEKQLGKAGLAAAPATQKAIDEVQSALR